MFTIKTIELRPNEIVDYFSSYIDQNKPIFFGRIGGSDTNIIKNYFDNKDIIHTPNWYESNLHTANAISLSTVKMYNGYFDFDNNIDNFIKYLENMIKYYKNSDDCFHTQCGGYFESNNTVFLDYILDGKTIINYGFVETIRPFLKSFTIWGKNKKILIVSPLSKSIEYQFKNKENLYVDYKFPEFELKTYNTKITYNSSDEIKENLNITTNNWHEECQRMSKEISKIDFDIALLSCASYGMFLGNHIKYNMGKKAIYLGGCLNLFFNIYGGRYTDADFKNCGLNLEYQIDPIENIDIERIKGGREKPSEALNAYFGKRKKNE